MSHGAIVTGTDGSESATAALKQAAELAASSAVALHVVSGYPPGDAAPPEAVRRVLETAREALGDIDVDVRLHPSRARRPARSAPWPHASAPS